jgi:hypothetical protein
MSGHKRSAGLLVLLLATLAIVHAPTVRGDGGRPLPANDSFYRYTGHKRLASIAPGTVLKQRPVTVSLGDQFPTPVTAEQLLYRTRTEHGKPVVTVTTVLPPPTPAPGPELVGYLSFYDGFGSECDPSYWLPGGYPGTDTNESEAEEEELLISHYLSLGWIVTVPDFEGEKLHWGAGQESGYNTLDAIRATETYLEVPATTKVGLSGYSGGAIAGDWASELAPHYAPKLNLVGVAEGGIPVDYAHLLRYVDGSKTFSGAIPGMLMAAARAFPLALHKHLSPYGKKVIRAVHDQCIASFLGAYPGLRMTKLLKPRYHHVYRVTAFAHALNHVIMGTAPGHPHLPLLMGVGKVDAVGDGVMIVKDVEALAHEYCKQGVHVEFDVYKRMGHEVAGADFEPATTAFLQQRFAGVPFGGNCSSVGKGNPLRPIRTH